MPSAQALELVVVLYSDEMRRSVEAMSRPDMRATLHKMFPQVAPEMWQKIAQRMDSPPVYAAFADVFEEVFTPDELVALCAMAEMPQGCAILQWIVQDKKPATDYILSTLGPSLLSALGHFLQSALGQKIVCQGPGIIAKVNRAAYSVGFSFDGQETLQD